MTLRRALNYEDDFWASGESFSQLDENGRLVVSTTRE